MSKPKNKAKLLLKEKYPKKGAECGLKSKLLIFFALDVLDKKRIPYIRRLKKKSFYNKVTSVTADSISIRGHFLMVPFLFEGERGRLLSS